MISGRPAALRESNTGARPALPKWVVPSERLYQDFRAEIRTRRSKAAETHVKLAHGLADRRTDRRSQTFHLATDRFDKARARHAGAAQNGRGGSAGPDRFDRVARPGSARRRFRPARPARTSGLARAYPGA